MWPRWWSGSAALDICVANAGGPPAKSFAETTIEDWRAATDLNLMSTVYFAKEALPVMQRQQWGRFIAITSVAVKQPVEGLILSNAVRSGVSGLIKTLANEYGRYGVLVNNVCPGYTATARLVELSHRLAGKEGVDPAEIEARWARQTAARPAWAGPKNSRTWWSSSLPNAPPTSPARRLRWTAGW